MTLSIRLPAIGTAEAWRKAARACLAQGIRPENILWSYGEAAPDLFAQETLAPSGRARFKVSKSFIDLADSVVWHSDPERFARLYALLWEVKDRSVVMADRGHPGLSQLRVMERSVRRCQHKMKAFVRFREIGAADALRRSFAAWFEPSHHTVEPTAPFFARRFADMDWCIVTPDRTAVFEDGELRFDSGRQRPPLPEDAAEELWSTYFRNIFNPSRLKVKAMQSEMPKKYWGNLPEARLIPELIALAEARAVAMRTAAPTLPPRRAVRIKARPSPGDPAIEPADSWDALRHSAQSCTRCPLYRQATQVVMGEGPADADLMFVGEQPGDYEDLAGRPFVGPAGRLFDEACQAAGIERESVFVTNAVKHFKFTPRGKKRIHQRPSAGEISHCRWWLDLERKLVRPRLIVALGATAAEALTGRGQEILKRRGRIERADDGTPVLLTIHPSYLLRLPDRESKAVATESFRRDLLAAAAYLRRPFAGSVASA
ncbi:MAG: UdgX family uracil-DNA binding protein [Kiloniellales bacterium]|nr:UdgX family uracil-DNA binding protein [Kiloniellales bacterium]